MKLKTTALFASAIIAAAGCFGVENPAQYVKPFVGTAYVGHTFPGPTMPFGLVQPGPETGQYSWKYCSGYNYDDKAIISFGQTHMNGTGCPDFGDVAFMPFVGDPVKKSYKSAFDKKNESSEIGLYKVYLDDAKAEVNITATERVAFYEIKFDEDNGGLFFNFQSGMGGNPARRVLECSIDTETLKPTTLFGEIAALLNDNAPNAISGYVRTAGFTNRKVYFYVVFDKPILKLTQVKMGAATEKAPKWALQFGLKKGETLRVKIAMSTASKEGAKLNMKSELDGWNFKQTVANNKAKWNKILGLIDAKGDEASLENFYTSMYHLFVQPNNLCDVDGSYTATNGQVKKSHTKSYHSSWSLWDTYRAAHPLYTILTPEKVDMFINDMLAHYETKGYLPVNVYWGYETHCMIGNHAISVLGEAIVKGFNGFDRQKALDAMVVSSTVPHKKSPWIDYEKCGYFPFDVMKTESVSSTMEATYNDACVAASAKVLGNKFIEEHFTKRSNFYKNLFDPTTKFMRGRDSKGNWREPFSPFQFSHAESFGGDYTEGSAWQYTWHVQHDPMGLIKLFGSNEAFCERLNHLFVAEDSNKNARKSADITGLIGQYVHGNEPSHHIVYLFALADQPRRTAELVREVFDKFYLNKPDGLCGNDDCGQMSAWYIFSAMGFYPVSPISAEYVLGAPQLEKAVINLKDGKKFEIIAHNFSRENKYVKAVKLNGKPYNKKTISHKDVMNGGVLEFEMCK